MIAGEEVGRVFNRRKIISLCSQTLQKVIIVLLSHKTSKDFVKNRYL